MPHHPKGHSMTKKLEKLPKQKIKKAPKKLGKEIIQESLQEMGKQVLAEKLTKNPIDMKYGKGPHMGHSPAEMGHSPAEMESDKQEKYNLLHDNPIAKHASGGSWMSKHSNSALNFNAPKHKHKHPKGDDRAYKGHTGNAPTSSNTSKKDLARMGSKGPQMGHSPAEMGHDSPAKNLGHGMDEMSAEKGAHRKYHLKQRMSKKSKDSINK